MTNLGTNQLQYYKLYNCDFNDLNNRYNELHILVLSDSSVAEEIEEPKRISILKY